MAQGVQVFPADLEFSADNLTSVPLHRFLAYLMGKTGGTRLPRRSDVDPTDIPGLLPHIFLIDVRQPPKRFRFRLIGTHITRVVGEDNTGRYFEDLPGGPYIPWLPAICERCIGDQRIQQVWGDLNWEGRRQTRFEAFYLPMSSDGETIDMICGGAEFHSRAP